MNDTTIAVAAWEALFRAQVSVMRYLNAEFPTGELSLNEYDVLFNLSQQPGRNLRRFDLELVGADNQGMALLGLGVERARTGERKGYALRLEWPLVRGEQRVGP